MPRQMNIGGKGPRGGAYERPKASSASVLRRLWGYLNKYKALMAAAIIMSLTSNLLALYGPKLSGYAVDGLAGLFETLYDIKQSFNEELEILGAIVNEYDKSAAHNVSLANVREAIPDLVFDNLLQHRSPIDTATMLGQPIWKTRNGKAAAQEFAAVFEELKAKIAAYEH